MYTHSIKYWIAIKAHYVLDINGWTSAWLNRFCGYFPYIYRLNDLFNDRYLLAGITALIFLLGLFLTCSI